MWESFVKLLKQRAEFVVQNVHFQKIALYALLLIAQEKKRHDGKKVYFKEVEE